MDHSFSMTTMYTTLSSGNFWILFALAVWVLSALKQQRRGWRRGGILLRTAMQLRAAGHTDMSIEVLCSLAVLHPRFAVLGVVEGLMQEHLENPTHRASLIAAYKAMHEAVPNNPGITYKLAHLYHLDGRDGDALALLDESVVDTSDTVAWKARMTELRDKLQTIPEDAKPATDGEPETSTESDTTTTEPATE